MANEAVTYFDKLEANADPQDVILWEREIEHAEVCRFENPAAMDILRARGTPAPTMPDPAESLPDSNDLAKNWIQLAINTEEQQ